MELKYNINIDDDNIINRLKQLINLIYKLLPMREENEDWQSLLTTIIEEIGGMERLFLDKDNNYLFPLLCKLEGLFKLTEQDDFLNFRKTIFECLNLINKVKEYVSSR